MNRPVLASEKVSSDALTFITGYHQSVVNEVANAVTNNKVVVVGMGHNPFVNKARKALKDAALDFKYLEYGNYWSQWK
nr:glutaredoxin [Bdellovibrionales bacterium]